MKTKACPFCGIENDATLTTCGNCFKVINNYRPSTVYKPKLRKNTQMLSLADFKILAQSCVESISGMSDELVQALVRDAGELLTQTFTPAVKALKRAGVVDSAIETELKSSLNDLGYFWALINYMLGVEYKAKRISDLEAAKYLPAVNFPFAYHLIEFHNLAVAKNAIPPEKGPEKERLITETTLDNARKLFTLGSESSGELKPKVLLGELCAFAIELKQIPIG